MKVNAQWHGNMLFSVTGKNGRYALMDASESSGGQGAAPSPKEVFLGGLAGCTGMDVVSILKKMRIVPESFEIEVEGELAAEHPQRFVDYHIIYVFRGAGLEEHAEKLEKAVKLSQERYCGISATLEAAAALDYSVRINP